jgi:hypothetical protein
MINNTGFDIHEKGPSFKDEKSFPSLFSYTDIASFRQKTRLLFERFTELCKSMTQNTKSRRFDNRSGSFFKWSA